MIQRIQSVWLFFAAFVSAALFIFPLYHYTPAGAASPLLMGAKNEYILLLLATVMTLLPMIAIFLFKNRKRQKALVWFSILASAGFIAAMLMKIQNIKNAVPPATNDNFALPGPVIPVVGIILLFLALSGIRKDDALIRSVDRLR
jgi:membrane protease YdiL (CAAX protease family)